VSGGKRVRIIQGDLHDERKSREVGKAERLGEDDKLLQGGKGPSSIMNELKIRKEGGLGGKCHVSPKENLDELFSSMAQ